MRKLLADSIQGPFVLNVMTVPQVAAAGIELLCARLNLAARLDDPAFVVLSAVERAYVKSFRQHTDRISRAATHTLLRHALAARTGLPASALDLQRDAMGRPFLRLPPTAMSVAPDFNVSHAGQYVLIAIASGRRVGVDIERHDRALDWQSLSPLVLTTDERAQLASLPAPQQTAAFIQRWAIKEALLKATGIGIGQGMNWFSVTDTADHTLAVHIHTALMPRQSQVLGLAGFTACRVDITDTHYAACVAWSSTTPQPLVLAHSPAP